MNVTKNGIPIAAKRNHSTKLGKPYRAISNPYKLFITLYQYDDHTPVWLIMPFIEKEVNQLVLEGWSVVEIWKKREK